MRRTRTRIERARLLEELNREVELAVVQESEVPRAQPPVGEHLGRHVGEREHRRAAVVALELVGVVDPDPLFRLTHPTGESGDYSRSSSRFGQFALSSRDNDRSASSLPFRDPP